MVPRVRFKSVEPGQNLVKMWDARDMKLRLNESVFWRERRSLTVAKPCTLRDRPWVHLARWMFLWYVYGIIIHCSNGGNRQRDAMVCRGESWPKYYMRCIKTTEIDQIDILLCLWMKSLYLCGDDHMIYRLIACPIYAPLLPRLELVSYIVSIFHKIFILLFSA